NRDSTDTPRAEWRRAAPGEIDKVRLFPDGLTASFRIAASHSHERWRRVPSNHTAASPRSFHSPSAPPVVPPAVIDPSVRSGPVRYWAVSVRSLVFVEPQSHASIMSASRSRRYSSRSPRSAHVWFSGESGLYRRQWPREMRVLADTPYRALFFPALAPESTFLRA